MENKVFEFEFEFEFSLSLSLSHVNFDQKRYDRSEVYSLNQMLIFLSSVLAITCLYTYVGLVRSARNVEQDGLRFIKSKTTIIRVMTLIQYS